MMKGTVIVTKLILIVIQDFVCMFVLTLYMRIVIVKNATYQDRKQL